MDTYYFVEYCDYTKMYIVFKQTRYRCRLVSSHHTYKQAKFKRESLEDTL